MNRLELVEQASKLEDYINKGVVPYEYCGLCGNVLDDCFPDSIVFTTWEHFRGSYAFPVEGNTKGYRDNDRKHNRRTKYGKLRLSLAKHCLEWTLTQLREAA